MLPLCDYHHECDTSPRISHHNLHSQAVKSTFPTGPTERVAINILTSVVLKYQSTVTKAYMSSFFRKDLWKKKCWVVWWICILVWALYWVRSWKRSLPLEGNGVAGYDFKILTKKTSVILCHVKSKVYYQQNWRGRGSWVSQGEVFIAGKCELNFEEHKSWWEEREKWKRMAKEQYQGKGKRERLVVLTLQKSRNIFLLS